MGIVGAGAFNLARLYKSNPTNAISNIFLVMAEKY